MLRISYLSDAPSHEVEVPKYLGFFSFGLGNHGGILENYGNLFVGDLINQ